ncbi:SNF1-related protein kinase regulatory subunit gamma-1-like protein [Tanacetum coccineum]|uniref:SNF1-related protein kinase regulatory subunit gamma-1-like protein n=1 Tax=Tanacetum coccineum TaxID=301880 RepID=A0ABQ5GFY7_9ASTR
MLYEKNVSGALIVDTSEPDPTTNFNTSFSHPYVGFLSFSNMVLWFLEEYKKHQCRTEEDQATVSKKNKPQGLISLLDKVPVVSEAKIGELAASFLWNPVFPVKLDQTLFHVLLLLSKHRLSVVPVTQHSGSKVVGYVTEHSVNHTLLQSSGLEWFDSIADKPLSCFRFEHGDQVILIYNDQSIAEAVHTLWKNKVCAIAVVQRQTEKLIGCVRFSDVHRLLNDDHIFATREGMSVEQFIHADTHQDDHDINHELGALISAGTLALNNKYEPRMDSPVTNTQTDTLKQVMKNLAEKRSNFSFLVDECERVRGMVTLRDILMEFSPPCMDSRIDGGGFFDMALKQSGCTVRDGTMYGTSLGSHYFLCVDVSFADGTFNFMSLRYEHGLVYQWSVRKDNHLDLANVRDFLREKTKSIILYELFFKLPQCELDVEAAMASKASDDDICVTSVLDKGKGLADNGKGLVDKGKGIMVDEGKAGRKTVRSRNIGIVIGENVNPTFSKDDDSDNVIDMEQRFKGSAELEEMYNGNTYSESEYSDKSIDEGEDELISLRKSSNEQVIARCGMRPEKLMDKEKGKQRKHFKYPSGGRNEGSNYPFRCYGKLMLTESLFHVISLNEEHKYVRNFKSYGKEILDVQNNCCPRKKLMLLFSNSFGSYGKEILDSNNGSTVKLGVTVNPYEKTYFDRWVLNLDLDLDLDLDLSFGMLFLLEGTSLRLGMEVKHSQLMSIREPAHEECGNLQVCHGVTQQEPQADQEGRQAQAHINIQRGNHKLRPRSERIKKQKIARSIGGIGSSNTNGLELD